MNALDIVRVARDAERDGRAVEAASLLEEVAPDFEYLGPRARTATITLAGSHRRTLRVGERILLQAAAGLPTSAEIRSVNVGVDGSTTIEYDVV